MGMPHWRGQRCAYCERVLEPPKSNSSTRATRDHVWPESKGGRWMVWACFTCNNLKADMTPREWAIYRQEHPRWWQVREPLPVREFTRTPAEIRALARALVEGQTA